MNLITIKNRYLCVQHRVGPSDSESTDFSRARVLSGRTRSNLIHRFGETHGQQTVARSCDTIRNQRESHRICPVFLAGPNFCTRPFPSFRWVKKPRSLAERKAGVIQPDDVAICWPFLMVKGFRPHESEKARRVGNQCRFFGARTIVTERHTENSPSPPPVRYSGRFFSRTALAVGEGRERVGNDKVRLPFHTKSVVTRSRGGTFGPKREFTFTPNFVRSGKVSPLGSTRGRETQRKSSWVIGEASPRLDPRTRARTRGEARARRSQRRD